jgi:hypothetical protein
MISWLDLVSVYVRCIVLHEFILICVVLGLFILTASKCMFSRMLLWLYKLILNLVNFLTATLIVKPVCHSRKYPQHPDFHKLVVAAEYLPPHL